MNKDMFDHYVVRTDKLDNPMYFSGTVEGGFSHSIAMNKVIFNAYFFDDKKEAQELADELGKAWYVSNVSKPEFGGF